MTKQEQVAFKTRLKQLGQALIEQRIAGARQLIDNAQQAANSEEKSSAGDKYETARAMGHLEKDMHARQLAEHVKELGALHAVDTNTIYETVTAGAFIQCTGMALFMSVGLGKQMIDGQPVLFLSPQAPLAKLLFHKKTGDQFDFNNRSITIMAIY